MSMLHPNCNNIKNIIKNQINYLTNYKKVSVINEQFHYHKKDLKLQVIICYHVSLQRLNGQQTTANVL